MRFSLFFYMHAVCDGIVFVAAFVFSWVLFGMTGALVMTAVIATARVIRLKTDKQVFSDEARQPRSWDVTTVH
jgi:hypothetical protein